MGIITFDFNNMFERSIGPKHGVTERELDGIAKAARNAHEHIFRIRKNKDARVSLYLEWLMLPYQDKAVIDNIQSIGDEIAGKFDNVISLGIGGSFLGIKAGQDALRPPYYNDFKELRDGRPRMYFEGNNLDPETLSALLRNLDPRRTFVVVISKSGETTETKAAFVVVENWLKRRLGNSYGRNIFAITDPESGALRRRVDNENSKDPKCFRSLPVLKGVGGRFSEFNIGLLHLAITGIKISEVLNGAREMSDRCSSCEIYRNPALMYAALHTILYRKKGKDIAIMMPFSETLKSTADWYVQLLAESLGKKYFRRIISKGPAEIWENDRRIFCGGRTPVAARGTNDLHSIQQNNIEGKNNKAVTFIKVESFKNDIAVKGSGDFLSGKEYSSILSIAEEATEWALVMESRPSCTITLPRITPGMWGGLLFFFEMATAYEGEFLGINAFDQPGVESYKNYLYHKLGKSGLPAGISRHIRANPLTRSKKYIIGS